MRCDFSQLRTSDVTLIQDEKQDNPSQWIRQAGHQITQVSKIIIYQRWTMWNASVYLWLRMSTLSARAVLGVNAPISQSLTLLRTLQKLGLGDLDLARGPDLSFVFLLVPPPPPVFLVVVGGLGAGVLSLVAGTDKFTRDISLLLEIFLSHFTVHSAGL